MNHADAKRIACQNCGSGAIRSQVSLGFITDTCRDCRATFFNEADLAAGMRYAHRTEFTAEEREENRAFERDGAPDREHDSMEC